MRNIGFLPRPERRVHVGVVAVALILGLSAGGVGVAALNRESDLKEIEKALQSGTPEEQVDAAAFLYSRTHEAVRALRDCATKNPAVETYRARFEDKIR